LGQGIRRIGVLTGGGDCPGLNAVIRAVAKTAMLRYDLTVVGIEDGFLGLVENRIHPLALETVSGILTLGGTVLGTNNKCDPTRYRSGDGEPRNMVDQCIENLSSHGIDALVCLGGDGTMAGLANFVRRGVPCVAVPKTIDNDIEGTEVTVGFATARAIATEALDRVHSTAMSHHRAMVVEVMGRNAGWIALHAGIASGSDVILLPEIPYDIQKVCAQVVDRSRHGKRFTILCVSEGAHPAGGGKTVAHYDERSPDPVRLGGAGQVLAAEVEKRTGIETRCTILGHVQRGGGPVAEDRILATTLGHAAVVALMENRHNRLVVLRNGRLSDTDILAVAGRQRLVPRDEPLIAAAQAVGTIFAG
jgi:ATP-dependent phosphofructokinase / diphosphate-dependent phosphofructokinase